MAVLFNFIKNSKALILNLSKVNLNYQNFFNVSGLAMFIIKKIWKIFYFYLNKILFLLMMDIAKSETFKNFSVLNQALLFLIVKI